MLRCHWLIMRGSAAVVIRPRSAIFDQAGAMWARLSTSPAHICAHSAGPPWAEPSCVGGPLAGFRPCLLRCVQWQCRPLRWYPTVASAAALDQLTRRSEADVGIHIEGGWQMLPAFQHPCQGIGLMSACRALCMYTAPASATWTAI